MTDLDQTTDQLVAALREIGLPADRYAIGPGSAGINVWAPTEAITAASPNLNRYPQTSIVLSDSGRFHDIAWGHRYQHLLSLDTKPSAVAAAVLKTLSPEIAAAAAASVTRPEQ
jgi:hypothetical protein